jgi:glycine hydroxymethyltransferase
MAPIAAWIDEAITAATKNDDTALDRVAAAVRDLLTAYPTPTWAP